MDLRIKGKKAIMAGGSAGMGRATSFLCSPLARFIVGQNIVIDGGQHASLF